MMKTVIALPLATVLTLGLALSGCKKSDDQPKAAAGGQLLERSVTDDMLPYDTVQSQASLSAPDDGLPVPRTRAPSPDASALPAPADDVAEPAEEAPVIEDAPPPPAQ